MHSWRFSDWVTNETESGCTAVFYERVHLPVRANRRPHTALGLLIGLSVSALALWLVIRWSGWQALQTSLKHVDWRFFGLSVVVYLLSMSARAFAWRAILLDRFSYLQIMGALNEGYLLNNLFPWRLGEIGRAILLGRKGVVSVLGVLSSIVVERTYDMLLTVILLASMLPIAAGLPGIGRQVLIAAAAVVAAIIVLLTVVYRPAWVAWVLKRLPGDSSRWQALWEKFEEGLKVLRNGRTLAASSGWMVASWILAGIEYWLMLRAVLPEAELIWAFLMLAVTLLGVAVPSSPGYIGVFEAAGVLALSVFGVTRSDALAATLLLHGMVLVLASSLGAVALALEGETLYGLFQQVRHWMSEGRNHQVT